MKVQFSVRLEIEDKKKMSIIAKNNKRTLNSQIEFIVSTAINDYEKVNGKLQVEKDD